jgi:hypothetical protein
MCCIFSNWAMINLLMIYVYNSLFLFEDFSNFGLNKFTFSKLQVIWNPVRFVVVAYSLR